VNDFFGRVRPLHFGLSMGWQCHALPCHGVFQYAQQPHTCTHGARNRCFSTQAPHARSMSVAAAAQSSGNGSNSRDSLLGFPTAVPAAGDADIKFDWRSEVHSLAAALRWALPFAHWCKHLVTLLRAHVAGNSTGSLQGVHQRVSMQRHFS
jgi:hypothetical protein